LTDFPVITGEVVRPLGTRLRRWRRAEACRAGGCSRQSTRLCSPGCSESSGSARWLAPGLGPRGCSPPQHRPAARSPGGRRCRRANPRFGPRSARTRPPSTSRFVMNDIPAQGCHGHDAGPRTTGRSRRCATELVLGW